MTDPWLAIEAATPPARRARELRREWERFVSGGLVNGVRSPVMDSWRRSLDAGVDPSGRQLAPVAAERAEASQYWEAHPLREAAPVIRACLGGVADESEHLIVVSDAAGLLLQLEGDARVRARAADSMNFTEGALWSENGAGTNAIGTAVATDHAVQIFASEHFVEVVHAWTCSAAPIHDPETGELIGVIDLTGLERHVHPDSLAVVTTTARAVEGHLRCRLQERDARLRARYRERIVGVGDRRALVTATGRPVLDDSRGWLGDTRLDLPPGGGELILHSGDRAYAEALGREEGFVVRELDVRRAPRNGVRDELSSLRRLAAAGAHGASLAESCTTAADEVGRLLGADDAAVVRFESDRTSTVVAGVLADASAATAVSTPIVVDGRDWGELVASSRHEPLAADAEERLANVAELVGMVIANAETRAELAASRARAVAAGDEARRRIERDLHDGAQQRLVNAVIMLKLAQRELQDLTGPAVELVSEALEQAETATGELRQLARGVLPAALSEGGLRAGIESLVSGGRLPVSMQVTAERLPEPLEAAAYFIVAEALTNAIRHAQASSARTTALVDGGYLWLEVRDDGVGGARSDGGSGLQSMRDRAAGFAGDVRVDSPRGEGTVVAAVLRIPAR
jgi:signal transduction histidine kinase